MDCPLVHYLQVSLGAIQYMFKVFSIAVKEIFVSNLLHCLTCINNMNLPVLDGLQFKSADIQRWLIYKYAASGHYFEDI